MQPNAALETREHVVHVRGAKLRYVVRGSGPALLVQPGGAGWGGDITPYLDTFGPLESVRTVVYLEPRGLGQSARQPGPTGYNISEYVADLDALRHHLSLERLEILGHSHGGFVALTYAADFPERVERLVLVGTTPTLALGNRERWMEHRPGAEKAAAALATQQELSPDARLRATLLEMMPVIHFHDYHAVAATFHRWMLDMVVSAEPFLSFMEHEAAAYDARKLLGRIAAPTLVVVGDDEMPEIMLGSELLQNGIPNARRAVLGRCGHWPMLEAPAALFEAIRGFLNEGAAAGREEGGKAARRQGGKDPRRNAGQSQQGSS
ncbi:MAG: alpha/beta hydrolase [Gemmatimonadota bacterium]